MQATDKVLRSLKVARFLTLASFFIISFMILINICLGAVIIIDWKKDNWFYLVAPGIFATYM